MKDEGTGRTPDDSVHPSSFILHPVGADDEGARDLTHAEVVRLREGDPEVAALLETLYRDRLLRLCWGYLGSTQEAEDAVQDIWHRILSAADVPDRFRPWTYKIARNHCCNLLRDRARRKERVNLPPASEMDAALTGLLTKLVQNEDLSRLQALVASLADTQREVLRLRYVEGLTSAEIAEVLGQPEPLVRSRLFEAMKKLRDEADRLRIED